MRTGFFRQRGNNAVYAVFENGRRIEEDFLNVGEPSGSGGGAYYATKADLEEADVPSEINRLQVGGYTSESDGGGGEYRLVETEPSHAGKIQSNDGAWWELLPVNGAVSVLQFGAVRNGTTDDQAAIQAAIDFVEAKGGGVVFVPDGVYAVGSTIQIEGNDVSLIGKGAGHLEDSLEGMRGTAATRFLWTGGSSSDPLFLIKPATTERTIIGGRIEGIFFDATGDAAFAFQALSVKHGIFSQCTFFQGATTCFHLGVTQDSDSATDGNWDAQENIFQSCIFTNRFDAGSSGYGLYMTGDGDLGSNASRNSFLQCYFWTIEDGALYAEAADNNRFFGCSFSYIDNSVARQAVVLCAADQDSFTATAGNRKHARAFCFYGCEIRGVYIRAGQTGLASSEKHQFLRIKGENFTNTEEIVVEAAAGGSDQPSYIDIGSDGEYSPFRVTTDGRAYIEFEDSGATANNRVARLEYETDRASLKFFNDSGNTSGTRVDFLRNLTALTEMRVGPAATPWLRVNGTATTVEGLRFRQDSTYTVGTIDAKPSAVFSDAFRVGAATGGAALADITGSGTEFRIRPTDGAGSFLSNNDLLFDVNGDGEWTIEGGLIINQGGGLTITSTAPVISLTDTNTGADSRISADNSSGTLTVEADFNDESSNSLIDFQVDGSSVLTLSASEFTPASDVSHDLGNNTTRLANVFTRNIVRSFSSVPDDDVLTITDVPDSCWVMVSAGNSGGALFYAYPNNTVLNSITSPVFTYSSGALTGMSGVDGDITISMNSGTLYIENRAGGSRNIGVTFLSGVT